MKHEIQLRQNFRGEVERGEGKGHSPRVRVRGLPFKERRHDLLVSLMQIALLEMVANNPSFQSKDIATLIEISESTLEGRIRNLRANNPGLSEELNRLSNVGFMRALAAISGSLGLFEEEIKNKIEDEAAEMKKEYNVRRSRRPR